MTQLFMSNIMDSKIGQNIIIAIIGVLFGFLIKVLFDRYRRLADKLTKKKKARQAQFFLEEIVVEINKMAGGDWLSPTGLYYKNQLAEEIKQLARDSRDVIDGETFFLMIRAASGLEEFSLQKDKPDSKIYSVDELLVDFNFLLKSFVRLTTSSEKEKEKEMNRIEDQIWLLRGNHPKFEGDEQEVKDILEQFTVKKDSDDSGVNS